MTADPIPLSTVPPGTLKSRTFTGLLVAQFLAAFNDQAIHAAAMFFAINTQCLTEENAISLMPILFYAPWALFGTVAAGSPTATRSGRRWWSGSSPRC